MPRIRSGREEGISEHSYIYMEGGNFEYRLGGGEIGIILSVSNVYPEE
jgi:hypothetical protein